MLLYVLVALAGAMLGSGITAALIACVMAARDSDEVYR